MSTSSISDLQVIDAYEDAIRQGEPFQERKGNLRNMPILSQFSNTALERHNEPLYPPDY